MARSLSSTRQASHSTILQRKLSNIRLFLLLGLAFSGSQILYSFVLLHEVSLEADGGSLRHPTAQQHPPLIQHNMHQAEAGKQEDTALPNSDKQPILEILKEAGALDDLDADTLRQLPTWSDVVRLYGPEPRVYGLETCEGFQTHSDPADHFLGVTGMFNSGTNLLAELLLANCYMKERMDKYGRMNRGIRWQATWGKHEIPPVDEEFRLRNVTYRNISVLETFPAVTIRDPFVWMQSMCRRGYSARWTRFHHCPNLVPNADDIKARPFLAKKETFPVRVQYAHSTMAYYESLIDLYNEWYKPYIRGRFPRLIVRIEDLVFHAKNVTRQVCECAGGTMTDKFRYIVDSAKMEQRAHGFGKNRTGLVESMIKYGTDCNRLTKMTKEDMEFARRELDPELMRIFGYRYP